MRLNTIEIIYRTFPYAIHSSVSALVMAMPIDHQQLLFTASLVDFPLSNAILKKKCILVVSLCLKWTWAGILIDWSIATVSVAMVTRHHMIETLLYAMQDGKEWLKVNALHGWLRACGAPVLRRKAKDSSLWNYGNLRINKTQVIFGFLKWKIFWISKFFDFQKILNYKNFGIFEIELQCLGALLSKVVLDQWFMTYWVTIFFHALAQVKATFYFAFCVRTGRHHP